MLIQLHIYNFPSQFLLALRETGSNPATISVTAQNPATGDRIGGQNVKAVFVYEAADFRAYIDEFQKKIGNFSRLENGSAIYIGDGEKIQFDVLVDNKGGKAGISGITVSAPTGNGLAVSQTDISGGKRLEITHPTDKIVEGYNVTRAYRPVYCPGQNGGDKVVEGQGYEEITNWKNAIHWEYNYDHYGTTNGKLDNYYFLYSSAHSNLGTSFRDKIVGDYTGLETLQGRGNEKKWIMHYAANQDHKIDVNAPPHSKWFAKVEDASLAGFYHKDDFEKIAYWYCPGGTYKDMYLASKGSDSGWQGGSNQTIPAGIVSSHVEATWGAVTDKGLSTPPTYLGDITVTFQHNGVQGNTLQIPLYYEERNCSIDARIKIDQTKTRKNDKMGERKKK